MNRLVLFITASLVLAGCNAGPNQTNIELIQNMMDQVSVKSQDWDKRQGDRGQMRTPPPHTVARGHAPYKYADDVAAAEREANPHGADMSPEFLTLGHKKYDIYCAVCHGPTGDGHSLVAEKMSVKPRNLIAADALAYSDGRIYYAITAGRGVMGSYASQIPDARERWAIVNYVRTLQKQKK